MPPTPPPEEPEESLRASYDPEVIERERAAAEARSIGPHGSGVLAVPHSKLVLVYFKVDWTDGLQRVLNAARLRDDLDSSTEWASFRQPDRLTASFLVEWINPNVTVNLYFGDLKANHIVLRLLAESGKVILADREAMTPEQVLDRGIMLDCDSPMLNALAWTAKHYPEVV